jgi:hypothetical protein
MAKQFRFLRDNPVLHKFIMFRINQRGNRSAESLGQALGIYPYRIRNYMKKKQPSLTDSELINICRYFKIKLELNIEYE